MEALANWIFGSINKIVFTVPVLLVIWESSLLSHRGSLKHWRRFGLSLSVAGFSMTFGLLLKSIGLNNLIVLVAMVAVVLLYALVLPLVVWTVAETEDGVVRVRFGPWVAALAGVFLYTFSVLIAFDIESLIAKVSQP